MQSPNTIEHVDTMTLGLHSWINDNDRFDINDIFSNNSPNDDIWSMHYKNTWKPGKGKLP